MTHLHSFLGATQVTVHLAPVQNPSARRLRQLVSLRRFRGSVYDNHFPIFVSSLFSRQYLAASTFSFLHPVIDYARRKVATNVDLIQKVCGFSVSSCSPGTCFGSQVSRSPRTWFEPLIVRVISCCQAIPFTFNCAHFLAHCIC